MKFTAHAKVNLSLHITGKRDDGYHDLSSIVAFTDFGDVLAIKRSDALSLEIKGAFAGQVDPFRNSVIDAVNWFDQTYQTRSNFHIALEKNLPVMAGLGGGTADCAAILRALYHWHDQPAPSMDELVKLGADVPVSYFNQTALMSGVGERIEPTSLDRDYGALLINPRKPISTAEAFSNLQGFDPAIPYKTCYDLDDLRSQNNSFHAAIEAICPDVKMIVETLSARALLTRMSGSGASVYALTTPDQLGSLAAFAREKFPDFWIMSTQLITEK